MEAVKTPILEGITLEEQEQMRVCFGVREERFRAGETVYDFAEGRKYLGLIARGSAVIQRIDHQGGRTILEHLESGGVFGEMLMFENVAGDSITVIAEEPCRVWFMQDEHMTRRCEKACAHHSRLVENMFHIMTEKAAALSERVEVLSRRSIRLLPRLPGRRKHRPCKGLRLMSRPAVLRRLRRSGGCSTACWRSCTFRILMRETSSC